MSEPVTLKLHGTPLAPGNLPQAFRESRRDAGLADDPFLPRGLIRVDEAYDLSAAARSTAAARTLHRVGASAGQVLVLELPDGVTLVTHAENLRQAIARIDPDGVDADGTIIFPRALRERGARMRGSLGDALADGLNSIVTRLYAVSVGQAADPLIDAAKRQACAWLGETAEDRIARYAELGVSWIGTKALMWAIESRLQREPGLYRWAGGELGRHVAAGDPALAARATEGPLLVMIHGLASSTAGSFHAGPGGSAAYWKAFDDRYGERLLAFEHRSLSESPIDNALALARALPQGARVHLLTHSRGGLVGDLLCLGGFEPLIDGYALDDPQIGEADPLERERIRAELRMLHADQRRALKSLAAELDRKQLRIERYVRVAAPARGTRLAGANFDVFLSALLSLMGWVPAFAGNPVYAAFKRVVLEIAKNRTRPQLVPGIEAMLPGSPMARFLARATPQEGLQLAVVSGDTEGGGWLKRLGVLFTDLAFFDKLDNDLVVDTDSMSAGVARPRTTRVLFDRGPEVNHFRYFVNDATRSALRRWLLDAAVEPPDAFRPLPGLDDAPASAAPRRARRAGASTSLPVTVLLPDFMGSRLSLGRRERVWFERAELEAGGLARLRLAGGTRKLQADGLFALQYGRVQAHLERTQRVAPFAFDWRQPLDRLADALALALRRELDATSTPLRLLAHGMGGLVARALVHRQPALWDELMSRDGARFVMLGTPNQGSYRMVEALVGKSDAVRQLGMLDPAHGLQEAIDLIAGFPGALQLLPKPGFVDAGGDDSDYFDAATWSALKQGMRDPWFGDGIGALPSPALLKQGRWLWTRDGEAAPALPARHADKVACVFGSAPMTPCGIAREDGRWKMLGTSEGDGAVTWASGRIDGVGQFLYMPAPHDELADCEACFESIAGLLDRGDGGQLSSRPPTRTGDAPARVVRYDAGPTPYPGDAEIAAGPFGVAAPRRTAERPQDVLAVRVQAMDLRQVTRPLLVGHYEQDAISGPEALIDQHLAHGELTVRHHLGLYPGAIGTASAVLLDGGAAAHRRGSLRGAVVTGLGPYDGSLTVGKLTDALRAGALCALVNALDSGADAAAHAPPGGLKLASLLIGYNSSANLSIADAMQALLRAIVEANQQFAHSTGSRLCVGSLDIVEVYLDTAITATYAARATAAAMNAATRLGMRIDVDPLLHEGRGMRQRLYDGHAGSYWPRLMITDADGRDDRDRAAADAAAPRPRAALAERLHYLYVGQRARAESVVQQRQPGLVERLVERQVTVLAYDPDFSRTLFQLLVPNDFKDALRQMQQLVLVLDDCTANFPWELMGADEQPLATRTAMVRQLSSNAFRARVRPALARRAYVVGNPSTAGFRQAPAVAQQPDDDVHDALDELPAAEQEARTVTDALVRHGFEVERAVGSGQRATEVVNRLYTHPYRIVHVAGHGMVDEGAADGRSRSGVVLSDGLLITAAEIEAMEAVPDLVFLNCCHLGRIDRPPVAFNKLASSVARQLIDIGVRAVVVAGWAVDDAPASLFADTFYEKLLGDRLGFGDAVFQARRATWERHPASVTWGAYQAYGDPGWRIDPTTEPPAPPPQSGAGGVAPEEFLERIQTARQAVRRGRVGMSGSDARRVADRLRQGLAAVPPDWASRPDLRAAAADLLFDLGPDFFADARQQYRDALAAPDPEGRVPMRAIERLADIEARLGEDTGDAALVALGISRLEGLQGASAGTLPDERPASPTSADATRAALLGRAWTCLAALHARACSAARGKANDFALMRDALARATASHAAASAAAGGAVDPRASFDWLFVWSLGATAQQRAAQLPLVERCIAMADADVADGAAERQAVMQADAGLLRALLGKARVAAAGADAGPEQLARRYDDALQGATPRQRDAVVRRLRALAALHRAEEKHRHTPRTGELAALLDALTDRLGGARHPTDGEQGSASGAAVKRRGGRR